MDFVWGLYDMSFMFFQMGFINRVYNHEVSMGIIREKRYWSKYYWMYSSYYDNHCLPMSAICSEGFFLVKVMQLIWSYLSIHGNIHGF